MKSWFWPFMGDKIPGAGKAGASHRWLPGRLVEPSAADIDGA